MSKAAALLTAFTPDRRSMGVSELARRAEIPKSTSFRLLAILVELGFVERRGHDYQLGQRLADLGNLVERSRHSALRDLALPFLEDLYELKHETVHLGVLDGTDVLYIEKIYGHNAAKSPSQVGGRLPARCSAIGKAMLAFQKPDVIAKAFAASPPRTPYSIAAPHVLFEQLHTIRSSGLAFERDEARVGLTCVAAPVFGPSKRVLAGISMSGPTTRFSPEQAGHAVRQGALRLTERLCRAATTGEFAFGDLGTE